MFSIYLTPGKKYKYFLFTFTCIVSTILINMHRH